MAAQVQGLRCQDSSQLANSPTRDMKTLYKKAAPAPFVPSLSLLSLLPFALDWVSVFLSFPCFHFAVHLSLNLPALSLFTLTQ